MHVCVSSYFHASTRSNMKVGECRVRGRTVIVERDLKTVNRALELPCMSRQDHLELKWVLM